MADPHDVQPVFPALQQNPKAMADLVLRLHRREGVSYRIVGDRWVKTRCLQDVLRYFSSFARRTS